ncbi:beta-ketoacyl-ACP synthase III [Streptomyces sp. NPDC046977]|uniref:beta-ketoacyl-ACP synthase III n=1 Tax=Streptomyces sp. NPDC046977 TaxID=3154703 RepID=UPI0033D43009
MNSHEAAPGRAAVVCGVGAALPDTVVSNAQLCTTLDSTDEWIRTRTGIGSRHIAGPDISTQDLAVDAARRALLCAHDVRPDAVLVATTTPDHRCPATAPAVAARLDLTGIPALDLAAGCTGFLYALATAAGFIASGQADTVLVIGADRLSTLPGRGDRSTVPLFGDGAGVMVLRAGPATAPGALGPVVLGSDGTGGDLIKAGHQTPLQMSGSEVFRHAVHRMSAASVQAARAAQWRLDDVDRLVAHQANARITAFAARQLGIPEHRQVHNIADVGNTGAASIPLLLAQAAADGRIKAGHRVLLTAFGAGLTWGATTLIWPELAPLPSTATTESVREGATL